MIKRIHHIGIVAGSIQDMMKTPADTFGFRDVMSVDDPQGRFGQICWR
jgi:hypothetical protein